jgi:hypothetical protein
MYSRFVVERFIVERFIAFFGAVRWNEERDKSLYYEQVALNDKQVYP